MARQVDIFVGRRKNATARVYLTPVAEGKPAELKINGRAFETYFPSELHRDDVVRPLKVTSTHGSYSVSANVSGGGTSGRLVLSVWASHVRSSISTKSLRRCFAKRTL